MIELRISPGGRRFLFIAADQDTQHSTPELDEAIADIADAAERYSRKSSWPVASNRSPLALHVNVIERRKAHLDALRALVRSTADLPVTVETVQAHQARILAQMALVSEEILARPRPRAEATAGLVHMSTALVPLTAAR